MISVNSIVQSAEQQTGLKAKLPPAVIEALHQLVDSLNKEAPLTERGWQSYTGSLINNLCNRLRVDDYIEKHPDILSQPIKKPMFVFGLPRTGTTLVINLLNEDPKRRCFLRWESLNSVPPPTVAERSSGPRYEQANEHLQMSLKYTPHIAAIHWEEADGPTECQFAMSQSFCAQYYESMTEIPSYREWFLNADYKPAFEYQKRLLQLLQSESPGQWTLKNPWHPLFLNDLVSVYPDAQLVMTHRDPVEVVGSACSLIKQVRALLSDKVDLNYIGESMMDTFAIMIERAIAYKTQHGWDSIYDLHYADVMRDPIGSIKQLYEHFGEALSSEAEQAMVRYLNNNPKGKFGKHEYNLEEYGLSNAMVRERFADYCQRFKVACRD